MSIRRKPPPGNVRRVMYLGSNIRGVTSNKRGHLVQFESEQERKLILLFERDATVADYLSQPETLTFHDDRGRLRRYTPDFKVWHTDGRIGLHEVSVESRRANRVSLRLRENAARAICTERGWQFVVHTDQTLPSAYEYANLDWLAAFRAECYATPAVTTWWTIRLADQPPVHPLAVLSSATASPAAPQILNGLYHLLWHGGLQMNWRQPFIWRGTLHPAARIWLTATSPAPSNVGNATQNPAHLREAQP